MRGAKNMGTRGVVAVGSPETYKGIYNHMDSYPSGLGADFLTHTRGRLRDGASLLGITRDLLAFQDWRDYTAWLEGGKTTRKGEPQDHYTQQDIPQSDIEWVYILDEGQRCIHVLDARPCMNDGTVAPLYVDTWCVDDEVIPKYELTECGREFERCHHYAWAHFPEVPRDCLMGTKEYLDTEQPE
jgi:hypothetical protein